VLAMQDNLSRLSRAWNCAINWWVFVFDPDGWAADSTNWLRAGPVACGCHFPWVKATDLGSAREFFINMTNLRFKGSWNEVKGKLKQKYGQLTDNDVAFAEGKEDELLGRLQQRLGKSKEDLRKEIESL
jgi:uncharacterized protein YjbJ (UPF0337 family)